MDEIVLIRRTDTMEWMSLYGGAHFPLSWSSNIAHATIFTREILSGMTAPVPPTAEFVVFKVSPDQ